MLGSATGHYQARTVRPSMQYFDCDLSFTEPLRTHKVLPEGLCIVQMFDGQWRHSVDGGEPYLYNLGGPRCSAPASRWRPSISCRRAAACAWAGCGSPPAI